MTGIENLRERPTPSSPTSPTLLGKYRQFEPLDADILVNALIYVTCAAYVH